MSKILPSLRNDIEVMPSPAAEQPGLLIRDPYHYTNAVLIIPPVLVAALSFLDGRRTSLELQEFLTRRLGQVVPGEVVDDLVKTLDDQGFLQTETFQGIRNARLEDFRASTERKPVHAGGGYPASEEELREQLAVYMQSADDLGAAPAAGQDATQAAMGIAAPHVSLFGGWKSYASAYSRLSPAMGDKTFVILGTSHYGAPEKFGLTRKSFVTPLGALEVDTPLVDRIAGRAGDAVVMEDYCHSIEHSIEFQCLFLQHAVGPRCRILPILCGPFLASLLSGQAPEADDGVHRFLDLLGEIAEREASRLFWVLGVDLTHIGKRYGDDFSAKAEIGRMAEVRLEDRVRLDRVCGGDRAGFLDLVTERRDALRWCGFSPLYTFLKAVPAARGTLLNYEQWNIDEESVVSFAALEFFRKD